MIGAFQDNYGGDIKFLFGIKMKKFIAELMHQKKMVGSKMKMF